MSEEQEQLRHKHQQHTISYVRQWVVLIVGVLMIIWSIANNSPAILMAGVTLVGGVPLDRAHSEVTA
jgi:Na+/proline symporter